MKSIEMLQLDAVLGVAPTFGRGIEEAGARDGANRALLISHSLWRRSFDADPGIIGRIGRFGDRNDTIVDFVPRGDRASRRDRCRLCWLPARRAAATDPIEALRHE